MFLSRSRHRETGVAVVVLINPPCGVPAFIMTMVRPDRSARGCGLTRNILQVNGM
jgi:hypothetical protein